VAGRRYHSLNHGFMPIPKNGMFSEHNIVGTLVAA